VYEFVEDLDVKRRYDDLAVPSPGRTCSRFGVFVILLSLPTRLLTCDTYTQNSKHYSRFPMRPTCPVNLSILDLISHLILS
jgi:hypothetical protein